MDGKSALHYRLLFMDVWPRLDRTMGDWIHVSRDPEIRHIYSFIYNMEYGHAPCPCMAVSALPPPNAMQLPHPYWPKLTCIGLSY